MLGIVLVMVGFVLFHNGWFGIVDKKEVSGKALSVVNFLGGAVILVAALYTLWTGWTGDGPVDYFTAVIYLMVGLTYIYIGFDHVYGLDGRPFGVFCLTGAIALFMGGILTFDLAAARGLWNALMWFSWALLWFLLFIEYSFDKQKVLGKPVGIFCLATTLYTGWIPGFMLLAGWW